MESALLLQIIIGILVISTLFEQLLSWLNLRNHKRELPPQLAEYYDAEKYAKSYDYHRTNYRFSIIQSAISFFLLLGILYWGGFGWLDAQLRTFTVHPIGLALCYFGVLFVLSDILSIPFQLYQNFVIEEKFGFNKMTMGTFWGDKLKSYALTVVMGGIVMGVLLWLIDALGEGFWIWFWIFISLFMLLMQVFYTTWLLPLFNKLTPLEEPSLKEKIVGYSQKVNFPLDNILVMDGSKRSAKSNAFFSGLGKRKKVVLFDTLIENHGEDELMAVLAHEVGHYKKKHIIQGIVAGILQTGIMLFILSKFAFSAELSTALGGSEWGIHLNLIAFGLLYSPISMIIGLLMNLLSRKNEFEADNYAATTFDPAPLREALIKLHADNLSNLTPHPFYVFMNYSHPPLLQRLEALKQV